VILIIFYNSKSLFDALKSDGIILIYSFYIFLFLKYAEYFFKNENKTENLKLFFIAMFSIIPLSYILYKDVFLLKDNSNFSVVLIIIFYISSVVATTYQYYKNIKGIEYILNKYHRITINGYKL